MANDEINGLLQMAAQLFDGQKHEEAMAILYKAEKLYKNDPLVNDLIGALAFQNRQFLEASLFFKNAVDLDPLNASYKMNLAICCQSIGNLACAVESYDNILEADPSQRQARYNRAVAYQGLGRFEESITEYRHLLKESSDARTYFNLGCALSSHGLPDQAIISYESSIELQPDNPKALNNLGAALIEIGRDCHAESCFYKAIALNQNYAEAYYNLHSIKLNRHDYYGALDCLYNAIRSNSSEIKYYFFLGLLLSAIDKKSISEKYFYIVGNSSDVLWKANLEAYKALEEHITVDTLFGTPCQVFELSTATPKENSTILEFGVRFGTSIRLLAQLNPWARLHGFDSFEGLPESWHDEPKGSYSTHGIIPIVPGNVALHPGWFEDTIPSFLHKHNGIVDVVNIDCDIYSSTKTVLDLLSSKISKGTLLIFDEFIGNVKWREDEYRAFNEWASEGNVQYKFKAISFFTKQVAIEIL